MDIGLLTLLMFGCIFGLFAVGVPIAFSLLTVGIGFTFFLWGPSHLYMAASSTFGMMRTPLFVAIPLFILMGNVLAYTGIAEELYTALYYWVGRLRGGLAMGTIAVGAIFASMCGTIEVGTLTVGIMALPAMDKRGYSKHIAIGSVAAGGLLGLLIPPSIAAICFAGVAGVSLGKLYFSMFIPGFLLASIYIVYIGIRAYLQPRLCPALRKEEAPSWREKFKILRGVVLPLLVIVLVLGGIYSGTTTPTEAAGIGALSAFIVAIAKRRLNWQNLKDALSTTFRLVGMVAWFIMSIGVFVNAYNALGAPQMIERVVSTFPAGGLVIIILMQLTIFLLGCIMEDFAIIMLTTPIFVPIVTTLGFDPVWFGVLVMVNIQCACLTPPFGISLFYMRSIIPPDIGMVDIYRGIAPFVGLQIICLLMVMFFPPIATWLPSLIIAK
jgi:tripartite ATP-independent transporter DctM subunit